jgi:hypothetical protein
MARPKRHKTPARLNITLDAEVKNTVILLAAEKGLSVGQLISQMVQEETSSPGKTQGNGQRIGRKGDAGMSVSRKVLSPH